MRISPPVWQVLRAAFIVCSIGSLAISLYTGHWSVFGVWWVVCLLVFATRFFLALFSGRAHNGSGVSRESVR
jgi:hypothetical protein